MREKIAFLNNDHRMMQVRKDLRWHLARPWDEAGRALRPGEVAWGLIQLGLENLQGQKLHNLSVQPVPPLCCPYGEKVVLQKNDEMPYSVLLILRSYCSGEEKGEGVAFLPLALLEVLGEHGGGCGGVSSRCRFTRTGHSSQPSQVVDLVLQLLKIQIETLSLNG